MMRFIKFIILYFTVIFTSCSEIKLEQYFATLKPNTSFTLDTIAVNKWDSVYIFVPYMKPDLDKYDIKIPFTVKRKIKSLSMLDSYCLLLFVKTGKMVNYASIPANTADFVYVYDMYSKMPEKIVFPSNQKYVLNENRQVFLENK